MSFLFAKGKRNVVPQFTGLQVQTAVNTMPIALAYGTPRVPVNIIYANGFRAEKQTQGGGKGLLTSGKSATSGYNYYCTFIGGISEGRIGGNILAVFDNSQVYAPGTPPNTKKNFTLFNGTLGQAPWSAITTYFPSDAFGYTGTCYVGLFDFPLDSSATAPQLNFLLQSRLVDTDISPLNEFTAPDSSIYLLDVDPAAVIYDFLTNETYGAGFPAGLIDTTTLFSSTTAIDPLVGDQALSTYCQAVGFAWSVVLNNAEPASSVLDRWCGNMVVAPVWTGNVLKFIPYYGAFSGANPGYYAPSGLPLKYYNPTPYVTPLFDLTDDNFIQTPQGDDPLTIMRVDIADVKNVVRVNFRDRNNLFNDNVAEAKDENEVELYGPRVDRMGTADEFSLGAYAQTSANLQLVRFGSVRRKFSWKLGWQWCILDPMDVVTLTDSTLGLAKFPVRIISIEEDDKGILTFEAEEVHTTATTIYDPPTNVPPSTFNGAAAPPNVNDPIFFEPTASLLASEGQSAPTVKIAASGGPGGTFDGNWGGCTVWLSNDNVTYVNYATLTGPSRMGQTTATLGAYSGVNPDTGHTLSVDLTESHAVLDSATAAQAAAGLTLCAIVEPDGSFELLAYETATLTAPYAYDITNLYRGLYNTVACSHPSGSKFVRVDSLLAEIALPSASIGHTIYAKLASFNVYGNAPEDLSACTAYTFVPLGAGFNAAADPIWSALLAGLSTDLNAASSDDLDLNIGGKVGCAPILSRVDLSI